MSILPVVVTGLSKRYGAVQALDRVDLTIGPGECLAVLGENGAGKSTLVKVLAGVEKPDAGTISLDGNPISISGPRHARTLGICLSHQELPFVPKMSVAENVFLGMEKKTLGVLRSDGNRVKRIRSILQSLGLTLDLGRRMDTLSVAERQLVEIAKDISQDAELFLLDEPTAALAAAEVTRLFNVIRRLLADKKAVIYISHRVNEIADIASRVVVLRDGRKAGELPPTASGRQVVGLMVGRNIDEFYPQVPHEAGERALNVEKLATAGVSQISFSLHAGEILGLGGLVGAGYTEVALALYGLLPWSSGEVTIGDLVYTALTPARSIRGGLAMVPEDRHRDGLNLTASIGDNITLPVVAKTSRGTVLDLPRLRRITAEAMSRLRIRAVSARQRVSELSGGNQQKVALAKALAAEPRILILLEPTRGIDIGAKVEIYETLGRLAAQKRAILMISSDLDELRHVADRLLIFYRGRIQGELSRAEATAEAVTLLATGQPLEPAG